MNKKQELDNIDIMLSKWIRSQWNFKLRSDLHRAIVKYEELYNVTLSVEIVEKSNV